MLYNNVIFSETEPDPINTPVMPWQDAVAGFVLFDRDAQFWSRREPPQPPWLVAGGSELAAGAYRTLYLLLTVQVEDLAQKDLGQPPSWLKLCISPTGGAVLWMLDHTLQRGVPVRLNALPDFARFAVDYTH